MQWIAMRPLGKRGRSRGFAEDRREWRNMVEEAKVHPGLWSHKKKKKLDSNDIPQDLEE